MANLLNILTGRTFLISDSFHAQNVITLFTPLLHSLVLCHLSYLVTVHCFTLLYDVSLDVRVFACHLPYYVSLVTFHDMCLLCLVISNNMCL